MNCFPFMSLRVSVMCTPQTQFVTGSNIKPCQWNDSLYQIYKYKNINRGGINTRTGKGGGQILPSPHVFCEYLPKYSFDRRDFFNTCPIINGAPFGAKIEDSSIFRGLFLSPQSQHFRFSPS